MVLTFSTEHIRLEKIVQEKTKYVSKVQIIWDGNFPLQIEFLLPQKSQALNAHTQENPLITDI
jgi:hypothetical protein